LKLTTRSTEVHRRGSFAKHVHRRIRGMSR